MAPQPLESRVEGLENRVTQLEQLPARIDDLKSQVQQLRTEMRAEFCAVGTQMRVLHEDVIGRIALLHEAWSAPPKRRTKKG